MKYPTNSIKNAAAWLHKHGGNVLALDGKGPITPWKDWQSERQSGEEAGAQPWGRASGVSVVMGVGGFRCFDIDGCTDSAVVQAILDALELPRDYPWVVESGSGEGYHVWIRCNAGDVFRNNETREPASGYRFDHLELRWAIVPTVAPGSYHPDTGARYEFWKDVPSGPPATVEALQVQRAVKAVCKPKDRRPNRQSAAADYGDRDVQDVREALQCIPPRPDYPEWIRVISAVLDAVGGDAKTAESLLKDWSPEEKRGEYVAKLRSPLSDVTQGTLWWLAMQHGYDPKPPDSGPQDPGDAGGGTPTSSEPSSPRDPMPTPSQPSDTSPSEAESFSVDAFDRALRDLDGRDAECKATRLLEQVATLSRAEIARCRDILEDRGARVRLIRSWHSDAKAVKKEQQSAQASSQSQGPQDLEHGELTAWITDKVQERDTFALDRSGALYHYAGGKYRHGGERYLNQRIKAVLDAHDMTAEFSRYRCEEVRHRIETGAPELWETPPAHRINLRNGILNLRTGELEEHTPEWLSTRQVQVKYDPDAEGSAWRDFFASVLPEDAGAQVGFEIAATLIRPAFGRRKAFYLHGGPSTGKSTLIRNLIQGVLGEDGVTHITLQDLEADSFARADLFGRMLNVCADLPSEPLEGTSVFKQITGGDRMNAQRKYKDRFNFTPHCNLLFSGNGPIKAPGAGDAFWDRWVVIPFRNQFSRGDDGHEPQDELDARLQDPTELSALLNEILRVLPAVADRGVTVTGSMAQSLDAMRRDVENTPAAHAGDGAHRSDTPQEAPEVQPAGVREAKTSADGALDAENPALKDFEKAEELDTGGACPKRSAFQSSESEHDARAKATMQYASGDRVQTPDGHGHVQEIDYAQGRLIVKLDDATGGTPYPLGEVEPADAPF